MSGSLHTWYSRHDLESFGERGIVIGGDIELSRLARLKELLYRDQGSVRASLRFRQHVAGWLTMELEYQTTVDLVCQRCLEPFQYDIAEQIRMVLLEGASTQSGLPDAYEPVALDGDRLMPAKLIEDEIIVALPLVPKHAVIEACGDIARRIESTQEAPAAAGRTAELQ